jgi:hypothetical protein
MQSFLVLSPTALLFLCLALIHCCVGIFLVLDGFKHLFNVIFSTSSVDEAYEKKRCARKLIATFLCAICTFADLWFICFRPEITLSTFHVSTITMLSLLSLLPTYIIAEYQDDWHTLIP